MMMISVIDVALRSLAGLPIFGTFDLVELFLVTSIFLALPETFRREEHVIVNVIDHVAPAWLTSVLRVLAMIAAVVFLAAILWNSLTPAYDTYRFGDQTLDLSIPRYIHWLPILAGTAVSILIGFLVLLRALRDARRDAKARDGS